MHGQKSIKLLTYLHTYLITPCSIVLEKLTGFQLVKKFPTFYRIPKFITAFTSASHLSLSWPLSTSSMPAQPTSWRSIYAWVFQVISFSQFSPPKPCIHLSSPHTCYMPYPSHSSRFDHPNNIGRGYRSLSSSFCSSIHSPVTSSLLGPNNLNTLFSNTLTLRSSLNVNDQVSYPYKTTGKIIILYILIFVFLGWNPGYKGFYIQRQQAFSDFNLLCQRILQTLVVLIINHLTILHKLHSVLTFHIFLARCTYINGRV